ncbi:hypothetical protein D3C81_1116970 [compost metagenome]
MVVGAAQAGGIHYVQGHAVDVDMFAQDVPRGTGDIGDDGGLAPGQGVQQAGFAGIRPAGDDHRHAVAQQCALACFTQDSRQFVAYGIELVEHMAIGEEVDLFLGEIDGRFDVHAQLDELVGQAVHPPGEFALQRTQRVACGLGGAGFDKVGDGLSLGEIELVVEEGALAELAWTGLACTQLEAALQQHVHHHRTAMSLQFEHVFAGEGVGAGEEQQQALVDLLAVVGVEGAVVGIPGLRLAAAQGDGHGPGARPGYPDDAHAAAPLGGGYSGDGFTGCIHCATPDSRTPHEGAFWRLAGWAIRPMPCSLPLRSAG